MIVQLLFTASPVIFAAIFHMIVVKQNWLRKLCFPLDHYKTYQNHRIFGNHKTYRGLVIMVLAAVFFTYILYRLLNFFPVLQVYNLLDMQHYSFVFYGFLFGFGYVVGELPNSFIKRRLEVKEGKTSSFWMRIIDQIDSVFIIMLLLVAFSHFTWKHFIVGVFFYGLLHAAINYLLFLVGLRKEPF